MRFIIVDLSSGPILNSTLSTFGRATAPDELTGQIAVGGMLSVEMVAAHQGWAAMLQSIYT
jgi:hypothetical protein